MICCNAVEIIFIYFVFVNVIPSRFLIFVQKQSTKKRRKVVKKVVPVLSFFFYELDPNPQNFCLFCAACCHNVCSFLMSHCTESGPSLMHLLNIKDGTQQSCMSCKWLILDSFHPSIRRN